MNAFVNGSSNIAYSLSYGQNKEKGGEIILSNFVDRSLAPNKQAKEWSELSNDYRIKVYNIILSFSNNDTRKIRNIHDQGHRLKLEQDIIKSFLKEMFDRGNNITDCPYVVAHHGNTDNEHFHISILTTTVDGKRLIDKFIKKNACRAAAKVSEMYKLEASKRALRHEQAHQLARAERNKKKGVRKHSQPKTQSEFEQRMRRRDAVIKAKARKESAKYMIEKIAKGSNAGNFTSNLLKEGFKLFSDPKLGFFVIIHDNNEDKDYSYLLNKHLKVNMSLIPNVDLQLITRNMKKDNKEKKAVAKPQKVSVSEANKVVNTGKTISKSPIKHETIRSSNILQNNTSTSSGQHLEGNQNPDGTYNDDDLDVQWRKRNGYKI